MTQAKAPRIFEELEDKDKDKSMVKYPFGRQESPKLWARARSMLYQVLIAILKVRPKKIDGKTQACEFAFKPG